MNRLMVQYPERVPVIIESKIPDDTTGVQKFMILRNQTISQMIIKLRSRIKMSSRQAIFLFVNNCLPPNSYTVGQVWDQHKKEDGILYIQYSLENTFG
jgi:GABA(A) receptor-associated protein